jgi:hypothetical protein
VGEKWVIEKTTTGEQLAAAQASLERGDFLAAYYRWILVGLFSGQEAYQFKSNRLDNELLGLKEQILQETVEEIVNSLKK